MALVFRDIIDTNRDRPPLGHPGEVVLIDLFRFPTPCTPVVPKLTDQFLLLSSTLSNFSRGCDLGDRRGQRAGSFFMLSQGRDIKQIPEVNGRGNILRATLHAPIPSFDGIGMKLAL